LNEDFVFDQEEAFSNPDSDSAKLLNSHVDGIVASKVGSLMKQQQKHAIDNRSKQLQAKEVAEFKQKHNMSDEEFSALINKAKGKRMSLGDMHYIINRDQSNANVAKSTKADMVNQMKNVRTIPTTASGVNSPRAEQSMDDQVFDDLVGSGSGMDKLFG
jgi:DNA-binding transcriptional regulator YiaG